MKKIIIILLAIIIISNGNIWERPIAWADETTPSNQKEQESAQKIYDEKLKALEVIEDQINKNKTDIYSAENEIKQSQSNLDNYKIDKESLEKEKNETNTTDERKEEIDKSIETINQSIRTENDKKAEANRKLTESEENLKTNLSQRDAAYKEEREAYSILYTWIQINSTDPNQQEAASIKSDKAEQDANRSEYEENLNKYQTECKNLDEDYAPTDEEISNCQNLKNEIDAYNSKEKDILSAEQALYKYQTLKELTFNVRNTLNIDEEIVDEQENTAQIQSYFTDTENTPIFSFILSIINFAIKMIGSIAVLIVIIGGFILVLSRGNDSMIEKGKDTIKYAIIGLAISFMSYIIVMFVQAIFTN